MFDIKRLQASSRDNDLVTSIVKYADDTILLVKVCINEIDPSQEVVNQFFSWLKIMPWHVITKNAMN